MGADDPHEPRRKAALRSHDPFRRAGERADMFRRSHVLGEIEVVESKRMTRGRRVLVEDIRKTGQDGLASGERCAHRVDVAQVDGMDGEGRIGDRARIEACDVEPRIGQELRGEAADLTQAEHGDFCEHR
jgi:hypothetical protein